MGDIVFPEDLNKRFTGKAKFMAVDETGGRIDDNAIELPIPVGLTFSDTASYENADLGGLGGAFADERVTEAAQTYIGSGFKENASKAVKDMAARIGGNRVRARMGRTPNPNTRALFRQVNLRTFTFSYKLIPQSNDESDRIKEIIKKFRTELYPEPTQKQDADFHTGYFFPNRFRIAFYLLQGGKMLSTGDLPEIQPAYLTSFQAAYNSGGATMFTDPTQKNARFSEIDMNLTFMESKTLVRDDIDAKGF